MSEIPDEETIRVRRSWPGDPPAASGDDLVLEVTEISRRRGAASTPHPLIVEPSDAGVSVETAPAEPAHALPVARRSTYIDSADSADSPDEATDGSTIVAHRESRRRAARTQDQSREPDDLQDGDTVIAAGPAERGSRSADRVRPAVSPIQTPAGTDAARTAHTPDPTTGDRYGVRDATPVIASRSATPPRAAQQPIDRVERERRRRDGRRTILIVAGATSVVVVTAAVTLLAIIFS